MNWIIITKRTKHATFRPFISKQDLSGLEYLE